MNEDQVTTWARELVEEIESVLPKLHELVYKITDKGVAIDESKVDTAHCLNLISVSSCIGAQCVNLTFGFAMLKKYANYLRVYYNIDRKEER